MKCWNPAFNVQGKRVIIAVVQVGVMKIYVAAVEALRTKGKTGWNAIISPKLIKKLVWVPVISLCKIFIPSCAFDGLLCRNWPFSPPNQETLRISLIKYVEWWSSIATQGHFNCSNFRKPTRTWWCRQVLGENKFNYFIYFVQEKLFFNTSFLNN